MATYPGFIGGTGVVQSPNVNAERTINWMPFSAPGNPKANPWMPATPCVEPYVVLDNGPIRALFAQDGRMFAVGGTSFYEVFANHTVALRGSTTLDGRPATISSNGTNGNQLFITSGGDGYIYDLTTNVITLIADPDFPSPVEMGWFSDGYFGVLVRGTNQFNISALYDGTDWDALDVFQTSTTSDLTVAQVVSHRELFTLGSTWTAVWQNTGDDPVYQPIGGVSIEHGCAAAYSVVNLDNTVYFLGQNKDGARMVYKFNGYSPVRVSNDAIEYLLGLYPRVSDAIAWTYQEAGHSFYVLYLPARPNGSAWHTTFVYDVATGEWHERALWDYVAAEWRPAIGRCHCYAWGKHFVGARDSAAIYEQSMAFTADELVT
jgi:hypothetical protein